MPNAQAPLPVLRLPFRYALGSTVGPIVAAEHRHQYHRYRMPAALHAFDPGGHGRQDYLDMVPLAHPPSSGGLKSMSLPPPSEHFQGKSVVEHLKEARTKGHAASAEVHGTEMPGHLRRWRRCGQRNGNCSSDPLDHSSPFIALPATWLFPDSVYFRSGWIIWKTGSQRVLGWARIERLHRVIEEERWEIEHHRQQEKARADGNVPAPRDSTENS